MGITLYCLQVGFLPVKTVGREVGRAFYTSECLMPGYQQQLSNIFFLSSTGKLGLWGRTETLQQEDILRV